MAEPTAVAGSSAAQSPNRPGADPEWSGSHTSATGAGLNARFSREATALMQPLYRHAMRMTNNAPDAEDLLQDTITKAYAMYPSFQPGTNFNAWLYRIMTNTHIDGYRKARRQPTQCSTEQFTDAWLTSSAQRDSNRQSSAEDEVVRRLPDGRIQTAMLSLPENFRIVVYYADVAGLRYHEIAATLNIPCGTVKSRLNRGRSQLRSLLGCSDASTAEPTSDVATRWPFAEPHTPRRRPAHAATVSNRANALRGPLTKHVGSEQGHT